MEKNLRINEVADLLGYKTATIRKKLLRGEIGYFKIARIVAIPQSEVTRLLGRFHPPIETPEVWQNED